MTLADFADQEEVPVEGRWVMADGASADYWREREGPDRVLGWGAIPEDVSAISELRLEAGKKTARVPGNLATLRCLRRLRLTSALAESLTDELLSPSVQVLEITDDRPARLPPTVVLRHVRRATTGLLRFEAGSLPNLEHLVARLDSKGRILQTARRLESLKSLACGPLPDAAILRELEGSKLQLLQVNGGRTPSLMGIESLKTLTHVALVKLPVIESLEPLLGLPLLEEVDVNHCRGLRELDALLQMPSLRRLFFYSCGPIGVRALVPRLSSLNRLDIVDTD